MDKGLVINLKKSAKENENFREVLFTGPRSQLVMMALKPGEEIGLEVHDGDQLIYVVDGEGFATLADDNEEIEKGSVVFIPAGVRHNIVNTDREAMKLFTVYAPPQHKPGTIEHDKKESWPAEAAPDADSETALPKTS